MPTWPLALAPSSARPFDVVTVGESSLDYVCLTDWPVAIDQKRSLDQFQMLPGGQAATVAATCARLGLRARYVGCVGGDDGARLVREALARRNVDVVDVGPVDARCRIAVVIVDRASGRRTVLEHRDPRQRLRVEDITPSIVKSGRVVMVDATDIAASTAAAAMAREAGIPTVVDVDDAGDGVEGLLEHIDVLIASQSFPSAFTGTDSPGAALQQLTVRFKPAVAIMTLGPDGCLALYKGQEIQVPAPSVAALDTTGAGDAFRGGFISGWLRWGADADVYTLLEYANAVAALSCEGLGAQGALPDPQRVQALVTRTLDEQSNQAG
jgi:sugar/nucleoside kinase (ribokinase family)